MEILNSSVNDGAILTAVPLSIRSILFSTAVIKLLLEASSLKPPLQYSSDQLQHAIDHCCTEEEVLTLMQSLDVSNAQGHSCQYSPIINTAIQYLHWK